MIFSQQQLQFLLWLKSMRESWSDALFIFLNWFDTYYFSLVLIGLLWFGVSRKWGIRAFYFLCLNSLACVLAKATFNLPRPFILEPGLNLVQVGSTSFPSGGAMNAILISGMLILYWKSRWAWVVGSIYFILISFSRMYLGVHFPLDVLGGWVLGGLGVWLFWRYAASIEKWVEKNLELATILSISGPAAVLAAYGEDPFAAMTVGAGIGIWASRNWHHIPAPPQTPWIGLVRGIFGALSTLAVFLATRSPFWTALWFSWIGALSFQALRLSSKS